MTYRETIINYCRNKTHMIRILWSVTALTESVAEPSCFFCRFWDPWCRSREVDDSWGDCTIYCRQERCLWITCSMVHYKGKSMQVLISFCFFSPPTPMEFYFSLTGDLNGKFMHSRKCLSLLKTSVHQSLTGFNISCLTVFKCALGAQRLRELHCFSAPTCDDHLISINTLTNMSQFLTAGGVKIHFNSRPKCLDQ